MKSTHAIGFDIGGTKILAGVVNDQAQILENIKEPVDLSRGPQGLIDQILRLGRDLIKKYPGSVGIGIASAGPLSPVEGTLLDPTNFFTGGKSWGVFPLVTELRKHWPEYKIRLENDAAAAALALHWSGEGKNCGDFMVVTLGTGIGVGVFANGELVRAGRHLHTEASHMSLDIFDTTAPCGCGKLGCIEAFLSGPNFAKRWALKNNLELMTAEELTSRAMNGDALALKGFQEYSIYFAAAVDAWVCTFAPEKVILTGSFAAASPLFMDQSLEHLKKSLARRRSGIDQMPQILVSLQKRETGLIGSVTPYFT